MEAGNFDTTDKTWKTSKQDYLLQTNSTNKLSVQNIWENNNTETNIPLGYKGDSDTIPEWTQKIALYVWWHCCRRLRVGQTRCPLNDEFIGKPLRGSAWTNENDSMGCAKDYDE